MKAVKYMNECNEDSSQQHKPSLQLWVIVLTSNFLDGTWPELVWTTLGTDTSWVSRKSRYLGGVAQCKLSILSPSCHT